MLLGLLLLGSAYVGRDREGVRVVHAAWGVRNKGFVDVTAVVRGHVRDGGLRIHASNDELVGGTHNDPFVGDKKFLVLQWAHNGKAQPQAAWKEDDTAVLPLSSDYERLEEMATPMLTKDDFKLASEARPDKPSRKHRR
jgi:hypothetical protein